MTDFSGDERRSSRTVEELAERIFHSLADSFPVCSTSDEFHYFPQALPPGRRRYGWDNFAPEALEEILHKLSGWETELERISADESDRENVVDAFLLKRIVRTLCTELSEFKPHRTQPTFPLTIASVGLAEALESQEKDAWHERVSGLPGFLDQARRNLCEVPELFKDLGFEMISDIRAWLELLSRERPGIAPVFSALDRFEESLRCVGTRENFILPREIFDTIVRDHIGCGMEVAEVEEELDREIAAMRRILAGESGHMESAPGWESIIEDIPLPGLPEDGLIGLYRQEVERLGRHCLERGLMDETMFKSCPVRLAPVPQYLSSVRSAAAYSMPPGHPPTGGTFYIIDVDVPENLRHDLHRQYRMLSAHETYPGHHLLDAHRWSLDRAVRRPVEFPLFYEGWACFAEELLFYTGYFSGLHDRLLLAKRHLWRAIRGKVDLALQAGEMDIPSAAAYLAEVGWDKVRALSVVRKYALKPGYQLCYTIGIRNFRKLFDRYGIDDPIRFGRRVLAQGEIGFGEMETSFDYSMREARE